MRGWNSLLLPGILSVALFTLSGCGSGGGNTSGGSTSSAPSATTTSLALSKSSVTTGSSVTLSAKVSAGAGAATTGTVAFLDGTTQLGTALVNSSGQASFSSTNFAAGTHSLTANYGGNSSYAASVSAAATLTVTAPPPAASSTVSLSSALATATQGLPVELVAQVAASGSGSIVPTGTVTFAIGSTTLGTATVDPTGVANFTGTELPVGSNAITASYGGDSNFGSSASGVVTVAINKAASSTYTNPLALNVTGSIHGVSCADPAIYKDQQGGVNTWYLYCTSDALYSGDPNPHYLAIYHSSDLVNWNYDGNAFSGLPSWANVSGASLWAPAIKYFNGKYYLYYAASQTSLAGNGAAIGVGTSASPAGPFVDSGSPVVEPEVATNCCSGAYRSTIDPDEIEDASGQRYILFGSFTGGIFVRKLSADGLTSDKSSEQQIAADNRYEGGNWWYGNGYYYLFASSTNCCNGPLSGYGVFVGRSTTPMGPYVDAQGISMTSTNVGGTPVLHMNGNSVIGPGGNVIFADEAGQTYMLYHGIVSANPYYSGDIGYTARPGFIDAIDWLNGWPVVRGGFGSSDQDAPQPLPAAQPGESNGYITALATQDAVRTSIPSLSDEFNSTSLSPQWSFLHSQPAYTLTGTAYQVPTVGFDTTNAMASVPMLEEGAPAGDYMVEAKLDVTLPVTGNGNDFGQAGLLIYKDDSDYLRLDLYSNNDTRQIEFIKAETVPAAGYPTWGATNLGAPAVTSDVNAWLRIAKRNVNGQEHYTAYSSNDGVNWIQSGTWVHQLGSSAKICLYAGNRAGYTARFDYVHVSTLQ